MSCILDHYFNVASEILDQPFPFGHGLDTLRGFAPAMPMTLRDLPLFPSRTLTFLFMVKVLESATEQELCCQYAEYLADSIHMGTDPWIILAIERKRQFIRGEIHQNQLVSTARLLRRELREIGAEARHEDARQKEKADWDLWHTEDSLASHPFVEKAKAAGISRRSRALTRASTVFAQVATPHPAPWHVTQSTAWALAGVRNAWLDLLHITYQHLENVHV